MHTLLQTVFAHKHYALYYSTYFGLVANSHSRTPSRTPSFVVSQCDGGKQILRTEHYFFSFSFHITFSIRDEKTKVKWGFTRKFVPLLHRIHPCLSLHCGLLTPRIKKLKNVFVSLCACEGEDKRTRVITPAVTPRTTRKITRQYTLAEETLE